MFRKLVLAASAAAALGASAFALSAPVQARDWDRNGSAYDQNYVREDSDRRRWHDDDEDGYRRPHHGWGWGWGGGWHRPQFAFGYNPYWGGHHYRSEWRRSYWAPRHRWFDEQAREW